MARSVEVDPQFGTKLRELRVRRGLSLKDLYRIAHVSKSTLSEYENDRRRPSAEMAEHLDRALEAGGQLAAMVREQQPTDAEQDATVRARWALDSPRQIDAAAVEAWASILASHRRADDVVDAAILLPMVTAGMDDIHRLAHQARGPAAGGVQRVAAEWTQFTGWLHAQARHDADAVRLLTRASDEAMSLDAWNLACQAWGFRGWLERQKGRPVRVTRAFMTAADVPGTGRLQRVDAMLNAVHGLGLQGERREALRLLGEADDMTTRATDADIDPSAYWVTPRWLRIPMGMAYLGLDRPDDALTNLREGLASLPDGWTEAGWASEYRAALDQAEERATR